MEEAELEADEAEDRRLVLVRILLRSTERNPRQLAKGIVINTKFGGFYGLTNGQYIE